MAFANSRVFAVETAPEAARVLLGRWKRVKRTIELALLCSLAITALVAWLSGVDVVSFVRQLAVSAGQAILAGLRFPVQLPLWAVVLLTLPSFWILTALHRRFWPGTLRAAVAGPSRGTRLAAPEGQGAPGGGAEEEAPSTPEQIEYSEDVQFGVVWRWPGGLSAANLRPHCPACDSALVPHPGAGSLSRGLYCESCNKIRAAGEHPSEILPRVVERLEEALESGDWFDARARVENARSRAEPTHVALPSVGCMAP